MAIINGDEDFDEIKRLLSSGKSLVALGKTPFVTNPTDFQISVAGRTGGNLATVINNHPLTQELSHEGFCSWQFCQLMKDGAAVCFADNNMQFEPIIEMVSTHKCFVKQAAMFEFKALGGKMFVCSFAFHENDPCAMWLKDQILKYVQGIEFAPAVEYAETELESLIFGKVTRAEKNTNFALNPNDIAAFDIKK